MTAPKKKKTPWMVFIAILLGMAVGSWTQKGSIFLGIDLYHFTYPIYSIGGKIFINALTLVVVPLVASSIITGIARIGNESAFGRLGLKIFGFYLATSLIAILIGLVFVNLLSPGSSITPDTIATSVNLADVQQHLNTQESTRVTDVLLQVVPSNIIDTLGRGQMLGLIFFSLIFGYCVSKLETSTGTILKGVFQGLFQAMIQFTHIIMKCLPLGVFFLVAKVFAEAGFKSLESLGLFTLAVILGLAVFSLVALPLLLKWVAKVKPSRHFRAMGPALITAFSTSSSSATLPITIECVEKRAGVSNKICSLVVPLGTSINMSGSALYECVAAMFVAQAYGIELTLVTQFIVVLLALITSIGVAGVPSASLVAIIAMLKALGLPIEGIGLFIAVDRVLDMCRTTVNVFSDSCCAILVARSEGESKVLSKDISKLAK
jgi:proton glutamate symport protein